MIKSYSDVDMQGLEIHNCPSIPKKTSELNNDSMFVTQEELSLLIGQMIGDIFEGAPGYGSLFWSLATSDGDVLTNDSGLEISGRTVYKKM